MLSRHWIHVASFVLCAVLAACGDKSAPPASSAATQPPKPVYTSNGDPRAKIFLEKGCPQCHSISAFDIKSPTDVGPDLAFAYTDVNDRFGMKLEEFLHNPTGTMAIVLSSQIKLSEEERDSVIHILKGVSERHEGKKAP
jgi:cytochrome c2